MNFWMTAGAAFLLGVNHAMEPGHGKGMIIAYLTRLKASWRHVVLLSLWAALCHVVTVTLIGLVCVYLFRQLQHQLPYLLPLLQCLSGLLILWLGFRLTQPHAHHHHCDSSVSELHQDAHGHQEPHTHEPVAIVSKQMLPKEIWLSLALTGLTPCATTITVLINALNTSGLKDLGPLLSSLLVFSLGMGAVFFSVGASFILAKDRLMSSMNHSEAWAQRIQRMSGLLMMAFGVYYLIVAWMSLQHFRP